MQAIFLKKYGSSGEAFEKREVAVPELTANQVLIKTEAFGINFADVLARNGLYREAPPLPCVIGYEVVGTIEEIGSGVPHEKLGERVVAMTRFGGYAEYSVTDHRAAVAIGKSPAGEALALATQYTTAYYAMEECMRLYDGDRILIHAAAGGVGVALTQLGKIRNLEMFGTAGSDEKLDFISKQGIQHPINYKTSDYSGVIQELLGDHRLQATFNSLSGKSFNKDLRLIGSGGKVALYGAAARVGNGGGFFGNIKLLLNTGFITPLSLIMRSKSIIGVNMLKIGDYQPHIISHCLTEVVKLYREKKLHPHIGGSFNASEIGEAHKLLESRKSFGKVVVHW